jgi:preprotein translocase subunit SecG
MYTLIIILIVAVCVFLTLIVLVQNSKGGGLAANFSASNQIMGVRKTADFLEKATWTLAGSLVLLCLLAAFILPSSGEGNSNRSILDSQIENAADPTTLPSFPSTIPTIPLTEPEE